MDKFVVVIEGGNVTDVFSTKHQQVIIVDRDTEGLDDEEVCKVLGEDSYVYAGIYDAYPDPNKVQQVMKDAEIAEINPDVEEHHMLAISTQHLGPGTYHWLKTYGDSCGIIAYKKEIYGYFIPLEGKEDMLQVLSEYKNEIPEELSNIISYATHSGYSWIMIDVDVPTNTLFPVY